MSEEGIRQLKRGLVRTEVLSFTIVMLLMGGLIYLGNLMIIRTQVSEVLDVLIDNEGVLPSNAAEILSSSTDDEDEDAESEEEETEEEALEVDVAETREDTEDTNQSSKAGSSRWSSIRSVKDLTDELEELFGFHSSYDSPEVTYSTRYFSVIFPVDETEEPTVYATHITAVNAEDAIEYASEMRNRWLSFGRFGSYYYKTAELDDGSTIVVVVESTSEVAQSNRILSMALIILGFGLIVSWLVISKMADYFVQPEIKNAELQKQFITNASHELKTPLAVIRANTELIEAMNGKSEWTDSTMRQVDRLQGLIQNLVLITRAQENDMKDSRVDTDITAAVLETVDTFAPVASQDGKNLEKQVDADIHMVAEGGQIRQLTSLLIDNAIKYCDDGGTITVGATKTRKLLTLYISNSYVAGADVDYTKFFDRFYRGDHSHNTDKGGYGIGLSIAESIVEHYRGSITASWKDGVITFTCKLYE